MLFLVWTNSSVCGDNIKSHLARSIWRKSKLLQKHQHVTSKHNTDQSKNSEHKGQLSVLKTKPNYSTYQANDTNQKKGRKWQVSSEKNDFSENIFHISFIQSHRNSKKLMEKSWQDVSVNLSENVPTITKTITQKSCLCLLAMSKHPFNLIFKTSQYLFITSLCRFVYFKVFF